MSGRQPGTASGAVQHTSGQLMYVQVFVYAEHGVEQLSV
jgi:hypothetical protein